jgi:uncharacterized protein
LACRSLRVRDHWPVARLELPPEVWPRLLAEGERELVLDALRRAGYRYVALDLAGLRTGSMNEVL